MLEIVFKLEVVHSLQSYRKDRKDKKPSNQDTQSSSLMSYTQTTVGLRLWGRALCSDPPASGSQSLQTLLAGIMLRFRLHIWIFVDSFFSFAVKVTAAYNMKVWFSYGNWISHKMT